MEHLMQMFSYRILSELEILTESNNISKKQLSEILNTTEEHITRLYVGDELITIEMIAKIEKVFGIRFDIKAVKS